MSTAAASDIFDIPETDSSMLSRTAMGLSALGRGSRRRNKDSAEAVPTWAWVTTWALTTAGAWMVFYVVGLVLIGQAG